MAEKKGLGIAAPRPAEGADSGGGGLVADLMRVLSALTSPSKSPPEQLPGLGRPDEFSGWMSPPTWRGPHQLSQGEARGQVFDMADKGVGRFRMMDPGPRDAAGPVGGELGPPIEPSASHQLQILLRALSGALGGGGEMDSPPPRQLPGLGADNGGVFGWPGPGDSRGRLNPEEVYAQVFGSGNRPVADYWPAPGPVGGRLGQPVPPSASHELQILLRALGGGN
jgi:hypothetical protein